jgi:hypothetical protein
MQYNREPLWTSGYNNRTTTYSLIQTLNQLRNHMVSTSDWAKQPTQLLATSACVDIRTRVRDTDVLSGMALPSPRALWYRS